MHRVAAISTAGRRREKLRRAINLQLKMPKNYKAIAIDVDFKGFEKSSNLYIKTFGFCVPITNHFASKLLVARMKNTSAKIVHFCSELFVEIAIIHAYESALYSFFFRRHYSYRIWKKSWINTC